MKTKNLTKLFCLLYVFLPGVVTCKAQTLQSLVSFNFTNGSDPIAALTLGADGNLYGTTAQGGITNAIFINGVGTLFRVTTDGTLTSLGSLNSINAANQQTALTLGADGNFYGTTFWTSSRFDAVFKLTTNGTLTSLAYLTNFMESYPSALTLGKDGNFYGTTWQGGIGYGNVFKVTTNGTLTRLASFNLTNGAYPNGMTVGNDGNFYGTTTQGGSSNCGTFFRVTTNGTLTSLLSFKQPDGDYGRTGLIMGNDGSFYGTTHVGGITNYSHGDGMGTIFKVTTNGAMTTLYSFTGGSDGVMPSAALTLGNDGNFYGTTAYGSIGNYGTVFQVTTNGTLTTLTSFSLTNGANPYASLTLGSDGNFYGTTGGGGSSQNGTVFRLLLPPVITVPPQSPTNMLGDTVSLTVSATSGTTQHFHWYFCGTNIDNGTNSTLIITNIQQPYFGDYYVIVSNSFASVTSSVATIHAPATIISPPTNAVIPSQSPATFSVTAFGYPAPSYQWTFNGTNINGATSNTLTISSIRLRDTGNYQVQVSNTISSTTSSIATLNMFPSITSPFLGATPIWGRSTTLSVGAIGSGTLTYQWYFNSEPIDGAVYPQLDFASIQFTNNGFYSVVISSPFGSVTNVAAQLTVNPAVVVLSFSPALTINGAAGNSYIIQNSSDLTSTNNWNTLTNLTLTEPVEIWVDTSVDASSPFYNKYFYRVLPQQ